MAVPCMANVASSANEDNWRRLERLLCELFLVLRALMVHPPPSSGATASNNPQPPSGGPPPQPPRGDGSGPSGGAGSSISVTSHTGQSCSNPVARGNAHRRTQLATPKLPGSSHTSVNSWQQLGSELRDIADTLSPAKRQQPKLIQIRRVPAIYEVPGEVTKLTSCLTLGVTALSLLRTAWGDAD